MKTNANTAPKYRLRLFLSVDLSGSTAFKFGRGAETADSQSSPNRPRKPLWLVETAKFYTGFTDDLKTHYVNRAQGADLPQDLIPRPWKTIGDEVVYVTTVKSVAHTAACVSAFIDTLCTYRDKLPASVPLDVKGCGWIAAFPTPNTTINLASISNYADLLYQNEYETDADRDPIKFDFLGTSIDCGFRISKLSTPERMPVSIELGAILAAAAIKGRSVFPHGFIYDGRQHLRGVLLDKPYPIIYVDTEKRESRQTLKQHEEIVAGRAPPNPVSVLNFLKAFMDDEKIEYPHFAGENNFGKIPLSYKEFTKHYIDSWKNVRAEDEVREKSLLGPPPDGGVESDNLPEAVTRRLSRGARKRPRRP